MISANVRRRGAKLLAGLVPLSWAATAPVQAQCESFGPVGPGFRASQSQLYNQIWSEVAPTPNGYVSVWSEGQNIVLRRYDSSLAAAGPDTLVNTTLNLDTQDEPAVATAVGGNQLIAWSERHGYDGEQMGIFGRIYDASGAPIAPEFCLNQVTAASQWRPLIAPTPAGGFVVTWSGDWDGDSFFRVFSATGAPLTNDVQINQFATDAQVDPTVAVASNGRIFVVFVDFSTGTSANGLDLYGRLFDQNGVALTNEFLLTTPAFTTASQSLPRVAVDGQNRFVVVWQSELGDGSSSAIIGRRFDVNALPLGPEFVVNSTTLNAQTEARVATESNGDFIVTWQDWSTGTVRGMYRRFDGALQPKGPDAPIDPTLTSTARPEVIVDPSGGDVVFAFEYWGGADGDVYLRRYQASSGAQVFCAGKVSSLGCIAQISASGVPSPTSPSAFTIVATSVINQSPGQLIYGYSSAFNPFQGGTLCLNGPVRTPVHLSGGSPSGADCTGILSYDFNARIQSGVDPLLVPGASITAQYYFRDALDPFGFGSGLSNAIRFTICP
jgi:hypothetical protein